MKQLQILLITFCFVSISAVGQTSLTGKWYMFSRNRMIEFNFLSDTLIAKQVNWDLSDRNRSGQDTQSIRGYRKANNNIYLYLENPKRTGHQIRLNTIKVVRQDEEIFIALNGTEKLFSDTVAASEYIQNDTAEKYGMPLFSESKIEQLKAQKKIEEMTQADFKTYANKLSISKKHIDSLSKLSTSPSGLQYYGYALIRIALAQTGYNPLITNTEFDKLILRFQNDPETKEIFSNVFGDK
jgi:hypothetical protein